MKYFLAILSILVSSIVSGCVFALPVGAIVDLKTKEELEDVEVIYTAHQDTVYTNKEGEFEAPNNIKSLSLEIREGAFWFTASENFKFDLYDVQGTRILQYSSEKKEGGIKLPKIKDGNYILNVSDKYSLFKHQILIQGFRVLTDLKFFEEPASVADTIIVRKEGYFERKIFWDSSQKKSLKLQKKEYTQLDFFSELLDERSYDVLQASPPKTNIGHVEAVKGIYDEDLDSIFFFDTEQYTFHYNFAKEVLGYRKGHALFNMEQYLANSNRYLYPFTINYHKDADLYVLEFFPSDESTCENIHVIDEKIRSSTYFGDRLKFHANAIKWETCPVPSVTSQELFEGINYQALSLEKSYGYLIKMTREEVESSYLGKRDIVLLNGIPNDISVVSGIITTELQTPLSHINVLSNNRNTPNMALLDAWNSPQFDTLLNKLVYLEVKSDSFILREASLEEAEKHWALTEPSEPVFLDKDTLIKELVELHEEDRTGVQQIGGKAYNFALVSGLTLNVPQPEDGFAIPFYFYEQHLKSNSIDLLIDNLLKDVDFLSNQEIRAEKLQIVRDIIESSPIDTHLVSLVRDRIADFSRFDSYRFRSSTNAEDLDFFSGAGLYSSYSAKKDNEKKTIERAIKKVWASLWNFRAYEERAYYKIDHQSVAMGILVHRSFPEEEANGVVVTKNLYNTNHGLIINTQFGEESIVFPEPGILHDQIIIYDYSIIESQPYVIEYISRSNLPELQGNTVLTDAEIYELSRFCFKLKEYYYINQSDQTVSYKEFALDIEFKIDLVDGERKLYIKQARIYQ